LEKNANADPFGDLRFGGKLCHFDTDTPEVASGLSRFASLAPLFKCCNKLEQDVRGSREQTDPEARIREPKSERRLDDCGCGYLHCIPGKLRAEAENGFAVRPIERAVTFWNFNGSDFPKITYSDEADMNLPENTRIE
jgi:hypothetical protein